MPAISWLHLTDLHFGLHGQEWLWPNLRQEFYNDLSKLCESAGPWDAIIFSGDLTQGGKIDEFKKLNEALVDLWKHLKSLGSEPVLIPVPGNHDLCRPDPIDPVVKALNQWEKDKEIRNAFWHKENNQYIEAIYKCYENYTNWFNDLPVPKPDNIISGYLPGDYSTVLTKSQYNVGFVCINTGFLQLTSDNYIKKLDVHEKQLYEVCSNDPVKWKKEVDLAFIVSHQPASWLSARASKVYNSDIAPPGMFFAHICGHLHEPICMTFSESGSLERRIWQGPSIFGFKTYGKDKAERLHGYNACKIEFFEKNTAISVWPRKMEVKYSGKRMLGPDSGYELNSDNAIVVEIHSKLCNQSYEADSCEYLTVTATKVDISDAKPLEEETQIKLGHCAIDINNTPQLKLLSSPQHMNIRQDERQSLVSSLIDKRVVWLISDWGQGKSDFIATALHNSDQLKESTVFLFKCEELIEFDEMLNAFEDQFSMTLQEFVNLSSTIKTPILLFDKMPPDVIQTSQSFDRFNNIIKAILDYNTDIMVILDCRIEVKNTNISVVKLEALDLVGTKNYLSNHLDVPSILTSDTVEHLYMWSDGLPMYLDYLIKSLKVTQLKHLVSIELESKYEELQQSEPVPKALLHAVATLSKSDSRFSRRSYKMLKILSIVSYGISLDSIRRFDNSEPFYEQNATELEALGLLDIIQVNNYKPTIGRNCVLVDTDCPKLLKVPKQVRDYVKSIISEDEYVAIIKRYAEIIFGERWREGKINSYISNSVTRSNFTGLGNEHCITRQLLWEAVRINDIVSIRRAIALGISYLRNLNKVGRFSEVYYGADELINIVSSIDGISEKVDLSLLLAQAARMIDKIEESIETVRNIIDDDSVKLTIEQRTSAYLDLALAYETNNNRCDAIEAAKMVLKFEKKGSNYYDQAMSIIIELTNDEDSAIKLKRLESKSRRLNRLTNANNIAITLADIADNIDNKIKYYDTVIDSVGNDYNRIRAVINKADILTKNDRQSELRSKDKRLLEIAFSYCYSQKYVGLFNKCTRVIWDLLVKTDNYSQLLTLFRYSSLLWRIRGDVNIEQKYIDKIKALPTELIVNVQQSDIKYYCMRTQTQ